jgi:hypothetical protein
MIGYGPRKDKTKLPLNLQEMLRLPDMSRPDDRENWSAQTLPWNADDQGRRGIAELLAALLAGQDDRIRFPWGADVRPQQVLDTAQMGGGWEASNDPMFLDVLRTLGAQKMMDRRGR